MTVPITAANSQNRSATSRSIHPRPAPRPLAAVSGLRSSSPLPNAARQLARCFKPTADHQHCQQQKWRRQQCHQAAHKARRQTAVGPIVRCRIIPGRRSVAHGLATDTVSSRLWEPAASLLWRVSRRARSLVLFRRPRAADERGAPALSVRSGAVGTSSFPFLEAAKRDGRFAGQGLNDYGRERFQKNRIIAPLPLG